MKLPFSLFLMAILTSTNVQGACLDNWPSANCAYVVENGLCDVTDYEHLWMTINFGEECKKSCGHCECEDIVGANCARVLEKGECDVYVGGIFGNEMVWPCQKTCDFCDGQECTGSDDQCAEGETCYGGKCMQECLNDGDCPSNKPNCSQYGIYLICQA